MVEDFVRDKHFATGSHISEGHFSQIVDQVRSESNDHIEDDVVDAVLASSESVDAPFENDWMADIEHFSTDDQ